MMRSLRGSGRTKESKEINKKEAFKHLKITAREVKSPPEDKALLK